MGGNLTKLVEIGGKFEECREIWREIWGNNGGKLGESWGEIREEMWGVKSYCYRQGLTHLIPSTSHAKKLKTLFFLNGLGKRKTLSMFSAKGSAQPEPAERGGRGIRAWDPCLGIRHAEQCRRTRQRRPASSGKRCATRDPQSEKSRNLEARFVCAPLFWIYDIF